MKLGWKDFVITVVTCLSVISFAASGVCAYTLSGTVSGGSTPVLNARVTLSSGPAQVASSTTDSTGFYSISDLNDGTYQLSILPQSGSDFVETVDPAPVVINGADVTRNVASLVAASSISGVVRNPSGATVRGISVCAKAPGSYTCSASDASGAYTIGGLKAGSYDLNVLKGSSASNSGPYAFTIRKYATLSVNGATTRDIDLPFVTLSGKVTGPTGAGVAGANLSTGGTDWTVGTTSYYASGYAHSDAAGNYSMVLLSFGDYTVTVAPPAGKGVLRTTVEDVTVMSSTSRDFQLPPASSISGVVRGPSGAGVENIRVCAEAAAGSACARSDASGAFSIADLSAGTYDLDVSKASSVTGTGPYAFTITKYATGVSVDGAVTRNIDLPLVTLSGKVTNASGSRFPEVSVSTGGTSWTVGPTGYYVSGIATSDANGLYSLTLLPYARYTLTMSPPSGVAAMPSIFENVDVTSSTSKDFQLGPTASIGGVVRAPSGVGVGNIKVCATSGVFSACSRSDATGAYSITGLGAATFDLDVSKDASISDAAPFAFTITKYAAGLTVEGATTRNVDLPYVTLSGRVTDGNGAAVGGVNVSTGSAYWTSGATSYYARSFATTDADGKYSMVLLPFERYTVSMEPPAGKGLLPASIENVSVLSSTSKDYQLTSVYSISGVVRAGGMAVGNLQICAAGAPGTGSTCARSDGSGVYSITGLKAGSYDLNVTKYASLTDAAPYAFTITNYVVGLPVNSAVTRDIDLQYVTLSGKLTDGNGAAAAGVSISTGGTAWTVGETRYYVSGFATSDAQGNYRLVLLPFDKYSFSLSAPAGAGVLPMSLTLSVLSDVSRDLALPSACTISGIVSASSGPLGNILVCVRKAGGAGRVCTRSDGSGAYRLSGLGTGTYSIEVSKDLSPSDSAPYAFNITKYVPALEVVDDVALDIVLPLVSLSGRTTDANGGAVAGVKLSTSGAGWNVGETSYSASGLAVSDSQGRYHMVLLPYEGYAVTITPPSGGVFLPATVGAKVLKDAELSVILSKSTPEYKVTVSFPGSGGGAVHGSPSGLACNAEPCDWTYDSGTSLTLMASPDSGSRFAGWSGACSNKSGECMVTVDKIMSVSAIFEQAGFVRVPQAAPLYYNGLADAYASAAAGSSVTIEAREHVFEGTLHLDRDVAVWLKGGFDPEYLSNRGTSTIDGALFVRQGKVIAERIAVR